MAGTQWPERTLASDDDDASPPNYHHPDLVKSWPYYAAYDEDTPERSAMGVLDTKTLIIVVLVIILLSWCCCYCSYLSALHEHDCDERIAKMNYVQQAHHRVHKSIRRLSSRKPDNGGTAMASTDAAVV
jgi:hypothetical protein